MIDFLQITFQSLSRWKISQLYFYPITSTQRRRNKLNVKGSKDKVKVTCPLVIQEYNQFMGGVSLSDEMKVTYEVDRRSKFRFYLCIFFNFLDIAVVNLKIVYNKIESAPSLSSLDFRYSIAQTMIWNFSSRKRAVQLFRRSKRSRGPSFDIVDHLPDFDPLEFFVPFVHQRMSKVELTYAV